MPPLTVVSLYTGAGGLDLGLEAAGFETRVAVELDSDAAATLRTNRDWAVINADIHSDAATSASILEHAALCAGDVDLLVGGPPCQPFSKSGYWANGDAKRLEDPRATTLEAYLRVLRDVQPRAFLLENVPGLAFSNKNEGLHLLERTIESINRTVGTEYSFHVKVLRAVEYGVPQFRERVFIVGARDGSTFKFPDATHSAPIDEAEEQSELLPDRVRPGLPFLTAWDAIGDLEDESDPRLRVSGKWADLLPTIPEGKNYLFHTDRSDGLPLFGWRRRYWSFLLKLSKRLPSWTLTAAPGPAIGPFHWNNRRLSPTELMRIQTFPRGYHVCGTYRSIMRQIGNAVPSALTELLGLELRRQVFRDAQTPATLSLLPPKRLDEPAPEPVAEVPRKYFSLVGSHDAHPGTGLGPRARARAEVATR